MNVLFLPKVLPRADIIGGPILVYHRIKNLSAMGHRVTVIAPAYDEQDRQDESLESVCDEVIRIDSVRHRSPEEVRDIYERLGGHRPKFFLNGDGGFCQGIEDALRATLKEKHIDAIIAEYSMPGQYIEANHEFIPEHTVSMISVHECYTRAFRMRAQKGEDISEETINQLFEYEFKMYETADKLLSLTQEDADILVDYSPGLKDKIRVVPHGVDTNFYHPPGEDAPSRNTKNILYIGNYRHLPNVDAVKNFIVHCWDKILVRVPDARFHAIGFNPPPELLELRTKSKNVIVEEGGDNQNVRRIYWNSDLFVAPIALGTGFRGKLLEAMACGLPVVATKLATFGINPTNEENMFVTDDYSVFSDYVIRLLKDVKLRKKIASGALALARKFDHRHAAEKLDRVLKEGTK